MKKILTTCLSAFFLPAYLLSASTALNPECRKQLIDDDWQFRLTVNDRGEKLESGWTDVDLPHDWSVLNDFDASASPGNDGGLSHCRPRCLPQGHRRACRGARRAAHRHPP